MQHEGDGSRDNYPRRNTDILFHPIWARKAVPHLELNLAVGMKGLYRYTSKRKTEEYVGQWNNEAGNLLTKGMEDQGTLCFFHLSL